MEPDMSDSEEEPPAVVILDGQLVDECMRLNSKHNILDYPCLI